MSIGNAASLNNLRHSKRSLLRKLASNVRFIDATSHLRGLSTPFSKE